VIGGSIAGGHEALGPDKNPRSMFTTRACCSICTETRRARCTGGRAEQREIYCTISSSLHPRKRLIVLPPEQRSPSVRVPMSGRTTVDLTWYGRSPPNMTKILYRWGLQPLLERFTHKCKIMTFRNGKYNPKFFERLLTWTTTSGGTGQLIGSIGMDKDFLEDLLAEFLFIQVCARSMSPTTTFTKIRTA
jgi:hypothetical protein